MSSTFKYVFSLTGHLNSLKDFAFTSEVAQFEDPSIQFLASCSQDKYIRLWKI